MAKFIELKSANGERTKEHALSIYVNSENILTIEEGNASWKRDIKMIGQSHPVHVLDTMEEIISLINS